MMCDCYKTKPTRRTRYDPITGKPNSEIRTAGYCSGTRENDLCDCGGDAAKCDFYPEKRKPKPITNFDRIKAMSVEEMAKFIPNWSYTEACDCSREYVDCVYDCEKCVMAWLESEVQSDA